MVLLYWEPNQSWVGLDLVAVTDLSLLSAIDLAHINLLAAEGSELLPLRC